MQSYQLLHTILFFVITIFYKYNAVLHKNINNHDDSREWIEHCTEEGAVLYVYALRIIIGYAY